jgi:hypothetical protein
LHGNFCDNQHHIVSFKVCELGSKEVSVFKKLLDLTNAYLAIEGLLKSRVLSEKTHHQLQNTLDYLDQESAVLVKQHADNNPPHQAKLDS